MILMMIRKKEGINKTSLKSICQSILHLNNLSIFYPFYTHHMHKMKREKIAERIWRISLNIWRCFQWNLIAVDVCICFSVVVQLEPGHISCRKQAEIEKGSCRSVPLASFPIYLEYFTQLCYGSISSR